MTEPAARRNDTVPEAPLIRTAVGVIAPDRDLRALGIIDLLESKRQPVVRISHDARMRRTLLQIVIDPAGSLRMIGRITARTITRPYLLLQALRLFPRATAAAGVITGAGCNHVHAVGGSPLPLVLAAITGVTYSISHAGHERVDRFLLAGAKFVCSGDESDLDLLHQLDAHAVNAAAEEIASFSWGELGAGTIGVRWISRRADSTIAEIDRGEQAPRVIFKQHREEADLDRAASIRARHEYDVLSELHRTMGDRYSVPFAPLVDELRGVVILERASGTPLDTIIATEKRSRDAAQILAPPLYEAGAWLRTMQDVTRKDGTGNELLDEITTTAVRDAKKAAALHPHIAKLRTKIADRIVALESRVRLAPLAVAGHHGDYWPGNAFISDGRVEVIDFEGFRSGMLLEDVAYFMIMLDLLLPRFRRSLPALRDSFLRGYLDGRPLDKDALALFTMTKVLHMMARDAAARHPLPLRIWMNRRLRHILERCLT